MIAAREEIGELERTCVKCRYSQWHDGQWSSALYCHHPLSRVRKHIKSPVYGDMCVIDAATSCEEMREDKCADGRLYERPNYELRALFVVAALGAIWFLLTA